MIEGKEDDFNSSALEKRLKESGQFADRKAYFPPLARVLILLSSFLSPALPLSSRSLFSHLGPAGVIPAPGAPPPNQQQPSYNFTNSTFGSGGRGSKGIRQGTARKGSDGEDSDRSD